MAQNMLYSQQHKTNARKPKGMTHEQTITLVETPQHAKQVAN
jgi:hypothetical protein